VEEAAEPDVVEHRGRLDDPGRGLVVRRLQDLAQALGEVVRQLARGHLVTITT